MRLHQFNIGLLNQFLLPPDTTIRDHKKLRAFVPVEVNDETADLDFLNMSQFIYKDDRYWIPYIYEEIKAVFDRNKNPYFKHGEARRWILLDKEKKVVGRIAAFVNFEKMSEGNTRAGGIGFFECINNSDAAFTLFDAAVQWLRNEYQVDVVDGPVNFGENDKFWGLLVKGNGFASYGMNYNPLYYKSFFESYGFQEKYKQFTNYLDLRLPIPDRFRNIAERVSKNPKYTFRHFSYQQREKYVHDFVAVYNQAWESFQNFRPMDEEVVRKTLNEMKPVMEETFIWFAYADDQPVALLVGMPDINQVIRFSGDRFDLWGKIKFMFFKTIKRFSKARVIVMGVVPGYQKHGLESALILRAFEAGQRLSYKHVELAWVGDFNDKMIAIHKAIGAVEDKTHITYRLFLK